MSGFNIIYFLYVFNGIFDGHIMGNYIMGKIATEKDFTKRNGL